MMNVAKNCKRLDNLLKNVLENFESDDKKLEDVNRENFRVINWCKFAVIDNYCKFYFMIDRSLNVIVIIRLNVMHVEFIVIQTIDLYVRWSFQHYIKFKLIKCFNCIIENSNIKIDVAFKNNESFLRNLLRNFIIINVTNLLHCLSWMYINRKCFFL